MSDRTLALLFLAAVGVVAGLVSFASGLDLAHAVENAASAVGVLVGAVAGSAVIGWLLGGFFSGGAR